MDEFALMKKIEPAYDWKDLVLADVKIGQLLEMYTFARHRKEVLSGWGFRPKGSRGMGISALFSGPSGTGKTMAAGIIARELALDIFRIDLSMIVNKYIGETEKNLRRVFDAAEDGGAVLFFDEADALFGERTEVKDAHDRYADIEISYLLQKMEDYTGIVILSTERKQDIDDAFMRRIHFIIDFPFPDEEQRRRIWEGVFPRETPLGEDVDFSVLARKVLSGGNIRKIALAAASYAADDNDPEITMRHLIQAAKREHKANGLPGRWP